MENIMKSTGPRKANQEKIEAEERAENERIEQFARDKREREATDGDLARCNWDFMENIGISIIMCMIYWDVVGLLMEI